MHPGWAAQAGYRAARMAQAGFTGPRTLFEGEHGFFHAFANSDGCDFTRHARRRGRARGSAPTSPSSPMPAAPWRTLTSTARASSSPKACAPDDVAAIECKTAEGIVHRLWEPLAAKQNPPNGYAAKFSIPYAIAVGMLRGDAGLDRLRGSGRARPRGARACRQGALRRRSRQSVPAPVHRPRARHARHRRSARGEPGAFSRRARRADVGRGARGEVRSPIAPTAAGSADRARNARSPSLRALRAAPRVDLAALRG